MPEIREYAGIKPQVNPEHIKSSIRDELKHCIKYEFNNINLLLIKIFRAKQLGIELKDIPELENIREHVEKTRQFFYLMLCLSAYMILDKTTFDKHAYNDGLYSNFYYDIYKFLPHEKIKEMLIERKINAKEIWESPTPERLKLLLDIFSVPISSKNTTSSSSVVTGHEANKAPIFTSIGKNISIVTSENISTTGMTPRNIFNNFLCRRQCEEIHSLLEQHARAVMKDPFGNQAYANVFHAMKPFLLKHLELLEERFSLLLTVLNQPTSSFVIEASLNNDWLKDSFPIILVCETGKGMELTSGQEYRATQPLTLGKEITAIATDTAQHQQQLQKYLQEHHITNVAVLLIKDLEDKATLHSKPTEEGLYFSYSIPIPPVTVTPTKEKTATELVNKPQAR